ncbi:MAG: hypothetical protein ABL872_17375 [Lacibacter sp.]
MKENIKMTAREFEESFTNQKLMPLTGSLCFWGHWFGRPLDNIHEVKSVSFDSVKNILTITFLKDEKLSVMNPLLIEISNNRLEIKEADRVHFEWYDYGKSKTAKNLFFYDFLRTDKKLSGRNNIHWSSINSKDLSVSNPAVALF